MTVYPSFINCQEMPTGPTGVPSLHAIISRMEHPEITQPGQAITSETLPPTQAAAPVMERDLALPAGPSQVMVHIEVPEGADLRVGIEAHTAAGEPLGAYDLVFGPGTASMPRPNAASGLRVSLFSRLGAWARVQSAVLPLALLWLALGLYAFSRLYVLPDFPIYFFTDEAVQTMTAADLLRDHFFSPTGELFPTYFQNGSQYNLSTSVYLQLLPYFFLGKSIWVTRGVAALMTLLAALSVGLVIQRVLQRSEAWMAVLFLSITPAWFLHSRTAFETSLATTFYAVFLCAYMVYRQDRPRYLYLAVAAAALAFYSYTPMRMVVFVTALLLLFSDFRYHAQHRKTVYLALGLIVVLALPLFRFLWLHPDATGWQMQLLGSYWIIDMPFSEKLLTFAKEYLRGLDPLYWYLPHDRDLARHTMYGYGHLLRQTLPLGLLGLLVALRRGRSSAYRTLIIAVLAAPAGAALVRLGLTRVLVMVIPMAILTTLGTITLLDWLHGRFQKISRAWLSLAVFAVLAGINLYMLRDAVVNGPLWYHDYGLNGMQYGARQVFGEVAQILKKDPDTRIIVSPSWSNGTDVVARFFFPDPQPFELGSATGYFREVLPLDDQTLFVMIPEEFKEIPTTRFSEVKVEKTLPYPDGRPGFYFVRLKYIDNIAEVMSREEQDRRKMRTETLMAGDSQVELSYTPIDMGEVKNLFDGRVDTLARSWSLNPMQLDFLFAKPIELHSMSLHIGGTATTLTIRVWAEGQTTPVELSRELAETPRPRDVIFELPNAVKANRLQIDVLNTNDPADGHVHLWEVTFNP